ncbi:type 1 fimbrial protein [Corticimicrobacter populi]|uniref:Type 1 fimbrial protein n=2 Tax=Corticimicrobacter populi TaxID=2175229 RepID=A0A2V1K2C4_9BURK|nr:type 1 fimbrial protein [Corticimicrobacter populi]
MKSISKFIFRAIAFCLAASAAHAQTATLNISGRITNTPCTISVGNVNMGDVPISEFAASNIAPEKYWKNFSVTLGGCELSTLSTASLKFKGTTAGDNITLALQSGTGAAQGFGVMIVTKDATHMSDRMVNVDGSTSYAFNVASGKKTFDFQAAYRATSSNTTRKPGTANATATITLTYS